MPKCVCAVFDRSEDYVKRLSGYVNRNTALPFRLFGFTKKEALEDFLKQRKVDLLLLPEEMLPADASGFGGDMVCAVFGDKRMGSNDCCVDKYQRAEGIVAQIIGLLSEKEKIGDINTASARYAEVTGIYSFGHFQEAADLAMKLASANAGQGKTLYINLTRFSGLETEAAAAGSLSDVIYCFRTGSEKITEAFFKARGRIWGIDVLTAPDNICDLEYVEEENWESFILRMAALDGADRVIVDLGEAIGDLCAAFELCKKVYLVADGSRDGLRTAQLKSYLVRRGRDDLIGRISEADIERIRK